LGNFIYNTIIQLPTPAQDFLSSSKYSTIAPNTDTEVLSTSECQAELIKWVDKHCCKGSRAAKNGVIQVTTFNALEVNNFVVK
jgi:hypothetical protein